MTKLLPRGFRALVACTAIIAAPAAAQAEQFINILTGGTSGVYYPIGVGLSKIYGEGIEGARTQVQSTKASVENLNLLQQGKHDWMHFLGTSKLEWAVLLTVIQRAVRKYVNPSFRKKLSNHPNAAAEPCFKSFK